jgi:hypothetical protein
MAISVEQQNSIIDGIVNSDVVFYVFGGPLLVFLASIWGFNKVKELITDGDDTAFDSGDSGGTGGIPFEWHDSDEPDVQCPTCGVWFHSMDDEAYFIHIENDGCSEDDIAAFQAEMLENSVDVLTCDGCGLEYVGDDDEYDEEGHAVDDLHICGACAPYYSGQA